MLGFSPKRKTHRLRTGYEGVLGTSLDIHIEAETESDAHGAEESLLSTVDRLESVFTMYKANSEFSRFQQTRGEWVEVSHDLAFVLHSAEEARVLSCGAFLPSVEALTQWWKKKESGEDAGGEPPIDPTEPLWEVDLEASLARRISLLPSSLNAIAKGYIIDQAVESAARKKRVRKVLVNLGGDLRHQGDGEVECKVTNPEGGHENSPPLCTITFSNGSVATSGGYRRGFQVAGKHHSHIFNPQSTLPESQILSATVLARSAMEADIWSTVLAVVHPSQGLASANSQRGIAAIVLDRSGRLFQNEAWQYGQFDSFRFKISNHT